MAEQTLLAGLLQICVERGLGLEEAFSFGVLGKIIQFLKKGLGITRMPSRIQPVGFIQGLDGLQMRGVLDSDRQVGKSIIANTVCSKFLKQLNGLVALEWAKVCIHRDSVIMVGRLTVFWKLSQATSN